MVTRLAAHYPNSGHTPETLKIVAEDWFNTFKGKLTDRAFIEAVTVARRKGGAFFPTEDDVLKAAGSNVITDCMQCGHYGTFPGGGEVKCANWIKEGHDRTACKGFIPKEGNKKHWGQADN